MQLIAISHYYQRDYDKAAEAARRTVTQYPNFPLTYRWLAAALDSLSRGRGASGAANGHRAFTAIVRSLCPPPATMAPT